MSHLDDFNAIKAVISAIKKPKKPGIPVSAYLQEASNLYLWCVPDKADLIKADLNPLFIDELPVRTGACHHAQSLWEKQRKTKGPAEKEWDLRSPFAYALRIQIITDFRHAFRKHPRLLKGVRAIARSRGDAGMIQGLSDLALFGERHMELLNKINFDLAQLDLAEATSREMGHLLGAVHAEDVKKKAKLIRDQAYTHLKEAVDEIRSCGKYQFKDDPVRLVGYRSEYIRKRY